MKTILFDAVKGPNTGSIYLLVVYFIIKEKTLRSIVLFLIDFCIKSCISKSEGGFMKSLLKSVKLFFAWSFWSSLGLNTIFFCGLVSVVFLSNTIEYLASPTVALTTPLHEWRLYLLGAAAFGGIIAGPLEEWQLYVMAASIMGLPIMVVFIEVAVSAFLHEERKKSKVNGQINARYGINSMTRVIRLRILASMPFSYWGKRRFVRYLVGAPLFMVISMMTMSLAANL